MPADNQLDANHTGAPFFGVPPKQPPVHVTVGGTDIFRVANGRIAETWVCSDTLALAIQLGAFPPPAAARLAEARPLH